ncbi:MAG: ATP-dependent DNA helicase RecQ [Bacteroidota bacterium]|nr:ATP-dependent DNA helicase RecQ [Bacteroidota bacterium]
MDKFLNVLKEYWNYEAFRPLQSDIILSIAGGKDTLGLMPTGGGKSITFQVPTMAMDGTCLVITPLIALMRDQVDNLKARGIKAAMICTGMSRQEIITTLDNCAFGNVKFLYVSPERLSSELFLKRLSSINICLIAVDEAHCISQWGYDFRPSYLKIAEIRNHLPGIPVLALTATATPEVIRDIQSQLNFDEPNCFSQSFARQNLAYIVREADDKLSLLIKILTNVPGCAIVYVRDRKKTKEVAEFLINNGFSANFFHAGLPQYVKNERQAAWKSNQCRVIVCTNAFGMGIDKPDVRLVIHLDLPDSPEAYFQEAGRAGRDGKKAYATIIYSKNDSAKLKRRISDSFPDKQRVLDTYNSLGNFYQLAVGSGFESVFPFDLQEFCKAYKLPLNMSYNALKIMEQAGYITLSDALDNPSRLMITVNKDELYSLSHGNPEWDNIIQVTLRSYTGLFADHVYINEDLIAQRAGSTRETVYNAFIQLSKAHIFSYIPAKKTPFITFNSSREDIKHVKLSKDVYETRKERFEKRIEAMQSYAEENDICRSQQLLAYFGQKQETVCGVCDVCIAKKKSSLSTEEFEIIVSRIKTTISAKPVSTNELLRTMKTPEDKTKQALRFLLDKDIISIDQNQLIHLSNNQTDD